MKRLIFKYTVAALSLICFASSCSLAGKKDSGKVVYSNGNIYTGDVHHPYVEAVVIENGKFIYVGNNHEAQQRMEPGDHKIDLKGRTVVPGLYDSHIHPVGAGQKILYECNFPGTYKMDAILKKIKSCAKKTPKGHWIVGGAWAPELMASNPKPTRQVLDTVSPDHPVLLSDYSHHNVWVNSLALKLSQVTKEKARGYGDLVQKDQSGNFTGLFFESGAHFIRGAVPGRTPNEMKNAAAAAVKELNKVGFIGLKDSYVSSKEYNAWKMLDDEGNLTARVALSWGWDLKKYSSTEEQKRDFLNTVRPSSGHLRAQFAKMSADGIPPTKTAAMLAPYKPEKEGKRGMLNVAEQKLINDMVWLDAHGYTTQVHAVGDRAARLVLDAVEEARKKNGNSGLRHEIAHACIIDPSDLKRFPQLDVVPNFSPIFWYPSSLQDGLEAVLGKERATRNCAMKTLAENNSRPTGGSDWPVSPDMNPWKAMEAMVTRKNPMGDRPGQVLWPEERITLEQALVFYTINGAAAQRFEKDGGSIEVGKSADMVVLDRNIFQINPDELSETKVLKTVFEGKVVYKAEGEQ